MNGTQIAQSGSVVDAMPAAWVIVETKGDYNGDGKSDILWRNSTTGQVYEYQMNGTQIAQSGSVVDAMPAAWVIVDAKSDYNGDGKSDILWRNSTTGQVYEYQMNGTQIAQSGSVVDAMSADWMIM
jgi:hypothetical protein